MDGQKGVVVGRRADGAPGVELAGERHTVATNRHDSPDLKGTVVETGVNQSLYCLHFPSLYFCAVVTQL